MTIDLTKMPKLGFGLMRLPEEKGVIDMDHVCRMVDAYMDAGMNYFDTAYVYHGGRSEVAAREALVKRYPREDFMLATKLPAWEIHRAEDVDRIFEEQLERAGVDYFDFYLLHSIEDGSNYETYEKYDCFNWGMKKKEEGQIKHLGFSFHGSPKLLEQVLDKHPEIEFVQIQLNYADWNNPVVRSGELYQILHKRQIPIIVMEPIKGGTLANIQPELKEMFEAERPGASAASWALRYVGSLPGVMTILSGMSTIDQINDNIATFTDFEPLSDEEKKVVDKVRAIMLNIPLIGCTSCRYCCDGCPMKISIPDVFSAVNTVKLYNEQFRPQMFYNGLVQSSGRASACVGCGQCEGVCPQHLPIIKLLKEASEMFDN
ncbi:MAG: aldo/keto reductase [Lachnospiraceae bacterium]|nr:aldo/keto reductase [Lachnospiraceae bacterium]